MIAVLSVIYVLSIYLSFFYPALFLVLFGVIGNVYDAFGIGSYISKFFSFHFTFMYLLFFMSFIISIMRYIKNREKKYKNMIYLSIFFSLVMAVSVIFFYLTNNSYTTSVSQLVMNIIYSTVNFSLLGVVILLTNSDRHNVKKLFHIFLGIQLIIAFLVIYFPNINLFNMIDGSRYQEKVVHSSRYGATMFNFFEVFSNKYYFNKFAQFHNSNDTGFYFGTALFISINKIIDSNIIKKILYIFISAFFIVMWSNSGMRAPIVGIFLSISIFIILSRWTFKKIISLCILLPTTILLMFSTKIKHVIEFSLGLSESSAISFTTRATSIDQSLLFLKEHYMLGFGGKLDSLSMIGVTPHFLPLKIGVMFGIITMVSSLIVIYIYPAMYIIKTKSTLYSYGLFIIVWLVSFTDNYTSIVLFNFIIASAIYQDSEGGTDEYINSIEF